MVLVEAVLAGKWVEYDPELHKDEDLYTIVGVAVGEQILSVLVPADVDHETAAQVPWYYVVWTGDGEPEGVTSLEDLEQLEALSEGGPESGHRGHKGIPGYQGGSIASGYAVHGLVRRMMEEGGFTRHIITGEDPTTGYMVSIHKDRERIGPLEEFDEETLGDYIDENIDLLEQDDRYLGGWSFKGEAYLDVSVRRASKEEALALAKEHGQYAIWGLEEGKEFFVDTETEESAASGPDAPRGSFAGGVQVVDHGIRGSPEG